MSGAPPRLPLGRCAAALNLQHVCPRAAGTRFCPRAARNHHVNFHEPPPAQASWPAGSHCVARSPQAMPAFPVRPQGGSPIQCYRARSCVACVMVARRLRRRATATQRRGLQAVQAAESPCTACESVFLSIAVKGPLRRCAPLTEQRPARRDQTLAAKEKTACLRARARAKMRF